MNENKKKKDLSNIWSGMKQKQVYDETNKPEPKKAIEKSNTQKFHPNSAAYSWNNEPASRLKNIVGDLKGKKGLGVIASGDQPYILFQQGLSSYLGFDISQVACFWNEIKTTAVMHLSRKHFLYFMRGSDSKNSAKNKINTYDSLRPNLTPYAQNFFDKVIERCNRNCLRSLINDGHYFRGNEFDSEEIPYTQNDYQYRKLQKSLQDAPYRFMWENLTNATETTPKEKFDIIFLSNIFDRWDQFGGDFKDILTRMKDRLAQHPEAKIIGNYQFSETRLDDSVGVIAPDVGLKFTARHPECSSYWVLQHE